MAGDLGVCRDDSRGSRGTEAAPLDPGVPGVQGVNRGLRSQRVGTGRGFKVGTGDPRIRAWSR